MTEFDFTLKFTLNDASIDPEEYVELLGEAGCDDAIIGIGQKGRIALQFTRASDNAFNAVTSAIKDVKKAIPNAKLIEATPDLVGLSDIAEIMGFTRQNMQKLMSTHIHSFPVPIHAGSSSIWHLSTIFRWLELQQNKEVEPSMKEVAITNMQINLAKENANVDHNRQTELTALCL